MKAIEINGEIKTFSSIPKEFKHNGKLYLSLNETTSYGLGFKDVVFPAYDPRVEKLENLHLEGDVYTYDVVNITIDGTLAELKEKKINQLKSIIGDMLSKTDWYVIRQADAGTDIPQDIKDDRAALRTASDLIEAEINSLTTKEAVVLFDINI
jgi:uncharacterized protein (UPF0297 family)